MISFSKGLQTVIMSMTMAGVWSNFYLQYNFNKDKNGRNNN